MQKEENKFSKYISTVLITGAIGLGIKFIPKLGKEIFENIAKKEVLRDTLIKEGLKQGIQKTASSNKKESQSEDKQSSESSTKNIESIKKAFSDNENDK